MSFRKTIRAAVLLILMSPVTAFGQPVAPAKPAPAAGKPATPTKPPALPPGKETTVGGKDAAFWILSYGGTPVGAFYPTAGAPAVAAIFGARYFPETGRAVLVDKSGNVTRWRFAEKKAVREKEEPFRPPFAAATRKALFTRRDDLIYLLVDDVRMRERLRKTPQVQEYSDRDFRVTFGKDALAWYAFPIPGQPEDVLNGAYQSDGKTVRVELAEASGQPPRKVTITLTDGLGKPFRSGPGDPLLRAVFYFPGKGFVLRTPNGWAVADTVGTLRQAFDTRAINVAWWDVPTEKDGQFYVTARTGPSGDTYRLDMAAKSLVRVPPAVVSIKPATPPAPGPDRPLTPSLLSAYDNRPFPVVEMESGYPSPNDPEGIRMVGVWRDDRYFNLWPSRYQDSSVAPVAPRASVLPGFIGEFAPMYRFVGPEWEQDPNAKQARTEIARAFGAWSGLKAGKSVFNAAPLDTGLHFVELKPPVAATVIDVAWDRRGADGPIGRTDRTGIGANGAVSQIRMWFNADVKWWFGKSEETPADAYHFYSTALHEIGHVCGLSESYRSTTVMIYTRKRGPKGPCFETIDDESRQVIYRAYSRPGSATIPTPIPTTTPGPANFPIKDLSSLVIPVLPGG